MKDILDKVKNIYNEKIAPALNKVFEKVKPLWEKVEPYLKKYKRYIGVAGLFVVMVLVLVFFTGKEFNAERIAKINSKEVSGDKYVPDAKFEVDAYPEVNELIKEYFDAYVVADFGTLEGIVTPLSEMEKSYIAALSPFYEEYQNIKCYTKHGLSKNSYIVSVCFDIKFTGQEVTAPSMLVFYVQTNKDGELYINNLYSDFNIRYSELAINSDVYKAIHKYTQQNDFLDLKYEVDTEYKEVVKTNPVIYQLVETTIAGTRQTWVKTVFLANRQENTENTESTETPEAPVTPETQTPAPAPAPEAAPAVQKVKISASVKVRVRSGAGTDFTKIGEVSDGQVFVKLGEETDSAGNKWVKIQYTNTLVGYVIAENTVAVTE